MPELPEVETIKNGLLKTIKGRTIKSVEVRLPKIISIGPATVSNIRKNNKSKARLFEDVLRGKKIEGIKRRAKMFIISLSGGYDILIHLKMTGQLIYSAPKEKPKTVKMFNAANSRILTLPHKYTHVIFYFTDGARLYFNDLRQFGYLRLVKRGELSEVRELQQYGPEPFSKDFTMDYLAGKMKTRPRLSVKQFLVEPKVVAGVGNIYSDEILYCAKVQPDRKVGGLKPAEKKALFQCIPRILKEGVAHHGSSVGDYFQVDGSEGTYGRIHRVYAKAGQLCRECGTMIKSVKLGGRTSSYCPVCQK
ncbi:MAG: DNA-formamidopyrimidine glycosylase [bacterium]|nr:DNA-formamidopyrimidine glycosylase [bacterium]